jgi:integrase
VAAREPNGLAAACLKMLQLPHSTPSAATGQRRGEVAGMTWAELSDALTSWTLPGERTKNGAVHVSR